MSVTFNKLDPGDQPLPKSLSCSPNFTYEHYLSLLVCGLNHFSVDLLLVKPRNSCVLLSNFLFFGVMV